MTAMKTDCAIRGVLIVFQTPFHADESIDFETLTHEIEWLHHECGVDGIVMAMVSEVLRLSIDERRRVAAHACEIGCGHGAVIISVGAESSHTAEQLARHAEENGAHAVMAIPPVSASLPEDELMRYYERIFDSVRIPVIVQDASGYVGRPMSIELQAGLFDRFGDRILFKPEAIPIGQRLSQLRDATNGRAKVFEGSGGIALVDSYRRGVTGTMPGADLAKPLVALWNALESGDEEMADLLSFPLASLVSLQNSLDAFVAVEKYLLVKQGIFKNTIARGPVGYVLDEETRQEVDRLFAMLMDRANQRF